MHFVKNCILFAVSSALVSGGTAQAQYALTTLAVFNGVDSELPRCDLIVDASGNLYGTTVYGNGVNSSGTVFKVAHDTHELTQVTTLDNANGRFPSAGLISDADGNFYGTTQLGGLFGNGVVYKIDALTHAASALASFTGSNGRKPLCELFADASGKLFGTTYEGGANNLGTVFEVDDSTHEITTLVTFNGVNGANPVGGLIPDASGNLYGTTSAGGEKDYGTVFKLDAATHALNTLVSFNGANGLEPNASLLFDGKGNLYGTTINGGIAGTLFRLNIATNELTTLATFNGQNGSQPQSALIADADGNLYGTTYSGGAFELGTVFKWDAHTNQLTTLITFDDANGANPTNALLTDANGNFYGTTTGNFGTAHRFGTVFRVSPVPEPSTLMLSLLAIGFLLALRQRNWACNRVSRCLRAFRRVFCEMIDNAIPSR